MSQVDYGRKHTNHIFDFIAKDYSRGGITKAATDAILTSASNQLTSYFGDQSNSARKRPRPSGANNGTISSNNPTIHGSVPMGEDNNFRGGVTNQATYNTLTAKKSKGKKYKKKKNIYTKLSEKLNSAEIPKHKAFTYYSAYCVVTSAKFQKWAPLMIMSPDQLANLNTDVSTFVNKPYTTAEGVTPGALLSPQDIRLLYSQAEFTFYQTEQNITTSVPMIVDLYFVRCHTSTPTGKSLSLSTLCGDDNTPMAGYGVAADDSPMTIGSSLPITPYDVSTITQHWSIYRHEQVMSNAGSCVTLQVKFPVNKTINITKASTDIEANYGGIRGVSYGVIVSVRSANGAAGNGTLGKINCTVSNTIHYRPLYKNIAHKTVVSSLG